MKSFTICGVKFIREDSAFMPTDNIWLHSKYEIFEKENIFRINMLYPSYNNKYKIIWGIYLNHWYDNEIKFDMPYILNDGCIKIFSGSIKDINKIVMLT